MEMSAVVSSYSLSLLPCFSNLGGSGFPFDLSSLMDLTKVVDLQFVKIFFL